MPAAEVLGLPRGREGHRQTPAPPDVVVGVGQLDLEVVDRSVGAQVKGELVVVGQLEGEVLAGDGVAVGPAQVEVHREGAAGLALDAGQDGRGAFRGDRPPAVEGLKIVEHARLGRGAIGPEQQGGTEQDPGEAGTRSEGGVHGERGGGFESSGPVAPAGAAVGTGAGQAGAAAGAAAAAAWAFLAASNAVTW